MIQAAASFGCEEAVTLLRTGKPSKGRELGRIFLKTPAPSPET